MDTKSCLIFNEEEFKNLTAGIQISQFMKSKQITTQTEEEILSALDDLCISDCLYCSFCNTSFTDKQQQRQHYKLDWHRYNLKKHLVNKKPVSEEKFSQLADLDDVSSISGSESESEGELSSMTEPEEDGRLNHLLARRARILFENSQGNILSLHQCLLHGKKEQPLTEEQLIASAKSLTSSATWMVIMLGGGHFAAAVFKGTEPIVHKTFHSYTVRAKQGSSQSTRDNKGNHPKSAGASLRRYNEQALTQHVQEILSAWATEITSCQLIFYRSVGPNNRSILFGGKSPSLDKNDPRLRTIPFPTRRATFSEVKRVHSILATVTIYKSADTFKTVFSSPLQQEKKKDYSNADKETNSPKKVIDRAKERPLPIRKLPSIVDELAAIVSSESECAEAEGSIMLQNEVEMSFDHLQEYGDTVQKKSKKKKKKKESAVDLKPEVKTFRKKVYTACELDDTELLRTCLEEGTSLTSEEVVEALNQVTQDGLTLLQLASQRGYKDIVWTLLVNGGNPCTKDKKSQTAYDHAPDKETRNAFRRFMGEFPDRYDFSKSHIPSPLTDSVLQEQAERKKVVKKAKRQKEKERKITDAPRRQEEAEKKRFLEMSDREKCALAAERRILAASGKTGIVLVRCYSCAVDITGKVPFTYETFLFCSMPCLKAHRAKTKQTS